MPAAPHAGRTSASARPAAGRRCDCGEVWQFRDLLLRSPRRDLKLRYKQTALGVIWVVLQPLMAAGIFSFVFGKVAKLAQRRRTYSLASPGCSGGGCSPTP